VDAKLPNVDERREPAPERQVQAPALPPPVSAGDLPAGSIVPEGGYESVLPEDDVLPEELAVDPCDAPGAHLPGIVVGIALRDMLKVELGDCVQVTSPTIGYAFSGGEIRPAIAKHFKVVGVFHAGFEQYDSKFVYTDLREAQDLYQEGDAVTGVEMKVADVDAAREVAERVKEELGGRAYDVVDWMELNHGLFTALRIQQILMSLVLGLIILVAAFTVIATLIMVVLDKKKEIAAIKAMGANDAQLLRAFLYQGLIIGVVGTTFGLGFGYVVCRWILAYGFPLDPKVYFIDRLPVQIRPEEFVLTGTFAIAACMLATLWPALHAARLRPAEAFRDA
jgi:lipoprotein-releasing system permease protein